MPNWAFGYVNVTGTRDGIKSFIERFVSEDDPSTIPGKRFFARSFIQSKRQAFIDEAMKEFSEPAVECQSKLLVCRVVRMVSIQLLDRWICYRTTPTTRLKRIVTELLERGCILDGVPGFYCQKDSGQWVLDIRGSGIMLPDRNLLGQI